VPADIGSLMVIGHNPASQMLVLKLADGSGDHIAEVQNKFPTGGLATLELSCDWAELGPGCARLTAFVRPKALVYQ
jgi:phosphohistidine phosphatase